ncbi:hypothetical protein AcV5_006960 [Taiwanofungus camphoratus]|nr:hypothetical protein AcV5_006960 [Antrodia cinnamomea]
MLRHSILLVVALWGSLVLTVTGLGSSCSAPLGAGNSTPSDPFWMQDITHQGTSAFNSDPSSYQVFRNVKDFGAAGDGTTDDTDAINNAISSGNRCGDGCGSSTVTPAVVFFPQGTYLVSSPIIAYYYTQLIGDAKNPPTLLASSSFSGIAVIDADPYIENGGGSQWYTNQDNFYRSVRNFVIDLTQMSASSSATGIHWQVSQSTSLMNILFEMSTASGNNHQGIYMENGSGGFMGDMVFNGGRYGMYVGNQQFTVRNVTISNADIGVNINTCQVGFYLTTGSSPSQGAGAEAIIDVTVTNTPVFVQTSAASNGSLDGSIVLNNIQLNNVPTAVGVANGDVVLEGGSFTIDSWAQGNTYSGTSASGTFVQADISSISKPSSVLDSSGYIFGKTHPQYAEYSSSQFMSVKSQGAKGDGYTDDTEAIQNVFNQYAGCYIIFFDAGTYIVTSTITIPAGTQVVGEAWSTIMANGSYFQDYNHPQVVVRVGEPQSEGVAEITDMIFTARGPAAGAIIVEWNVHDPSGQQGAAGTWDTHIILGGSACYLLSQRASLEHVLVEAGSNLQASQCPTSDTSNNNCFAAFLALHITQYASAYLEVKDITRSLLR